MLVRSLSGEILLDVTTPGTIGISGIDNVENDI